MGRHEDQISRDVKDLKLIDPDLLSKWCQILDEEEDDDDDEYGEFDYSKADLYRFKDEEQEKLICNADYDLYWMIINNEITIGEAQVIIRDIYGMEV